jgi:CheY-like chemotaxis protein
MDTPNASDSALIIAPHMENVGEPHHWRDVVNGLSAEIATSLTSALDRVQDLIGTGQIDRANLRALHQEIHRARQASMAGQQLARMASGQLRQVPERLNLSAALKDACDRHARAFESRDIAIQQDLQPAEVITDASLLFNLTDVLVSWSLAHTQSNIEFQLEVKGWPKHARLLCRFTPGGMENPVAHEPLLLDQLNTVTWRLLEQTAWTMGLTVERNLLGGQLELTLRFPKVLTDRPDDMSTIELDQGYSPAVSARVLANSHVLVIASRREVRIEIRNALRNMGLVVDFVNSMEDARQFCRNGAPHAVIMESILRGDTFHQLRS